MSEQLLVWEARYDTKYQASNGSLYPQIVIELLIATPKALLHYKIVKPTSGIGKVRIFTDVQAQSVDWWHDAWSKIRRHQFYSRMKRNWENSNPSKLKGCDLAQVPHKTFASVLQTYDLETIFKNDEKAQTAWMTAIGQSDAWTYQEILEKAAATEKAAKDLKIQARELELAGDPMWGIY